MLQSFTSHVLWQRAQDYVARYQPSLVAIAGSTGKTLTRNILGLLLAPAQIVRSIAVVAPDPGRIAAAMLGQAAARRRGLGLARLLTRSAVREVLEEEPDTILLELEATRPGQIDWVGRNLPSKIAIITNVHSQHLDYFQDKRWLAHEYASLVANLMPDAAACLNLDDPLVAEMKQHTQAKIVTFGINPAADVQLVRWQRLPNRQTGLPTGQASLPSAGFATEIRVGKKQYQLSLPHLVSVHQIGSVLAALAAAATLGVSLEAGLANLRTLTLLPTQLQMRIGKRGAKLIDASCEATPESVITMLRTLQEMPAPRKIAILGDLEGLAGTSTAWHEKIGQTAAQTADIFIAVGRAMRHATSAARAAQPAIDIHEFAEVSEVARWLIPHLKANDLILVSGSRPMRMSQIVEALEAKDRK